MYSNIKELISSQDPRIMKVICMEESCPVRTQCINYKDIIYPNSNRCRRLISRYEIQTDNKDNKNTQ